MVAATGAALAAYIAVTLPPRAAVLGPAPAATVVYGEYHVHTTQSDGTGTPDEVADAAARAGRQFLILTDHGDATRPPAPPQYRHGVLVIDACEVSTAQGHVVALGLDGPAPYPLAGEGADVIDDIHRLGGWSVIAHPNSPKPALQWHATFSTTDAMEWLNADSQWRDESWPHLAGTLLRYLVRPPEALASLFSRPAVNLDRWDTLVRRHQVVGLAATDAHGNFGPPTHGDASAFTLGRSSYVQVFRAMTQAAALDAPFSGDAATDARRLLQALRAGHAFSVITAIAHPGSITLTASDGRTTAVMGDRLLTDAASVTIRAAVPQAPDARLVLIGGGAPVATGHGDVTATVPSAPDSYRVEVFYGTNPFPWIVSNPVYIGSAPPAPSPPSLAPATTVLAVPVADAAAWHVEKGSRTTARTEVAQGGRALVYHLGPAVAGEQYTQYAALAHSMADNRVAFDRIQFVGRADRPMRLSVQVRVQGPQDQRWARSIYLDGTPRTIVIPLQQFHPVGFLTTRRPVAAHVQSVLFVVDSLNTRPGTDGTVWITDVALAMGGR